MAMVSGFERLPTSDVVRVSSFTGGEDGIGDGGADGDGGGDGDDGGGEGQTLAMLGSVIPVVAGSLIGNSQVGSPSSSPFVLPSLSESNRQNATFHL